MIVPQWKLLREWVWEQLSWAAYQWKLSYCSKIKVKRGPISMVQQHILMVYIWLAFFIAAQAQKRYTDSLMLVLSSASIMIKQTCKLILNKVCVSYGDFYFLLKWPSQYHNMWVSNERTNTSLESRQPLSWWFLFHDDLISNQVTNKNSIKIGLK